VRKQWSEIRPGTPKARVDVLLGTPQRVMRINGDLVWYYVYPGIGRGSVFFSAEEKVTAVQPPAAGWSW
jgi:outer membrane protein assembly factor BamE (lipoprotein component of BamABCDE complex)